MGEVKINGGEKFLKNLINRGDEKFLSNLINRVSK